MATPEEQLQTMISNMPEKTGKSLEDWHSILSTTDLKKHGEIMKLLKGEHGVTHGFANTISQLFLKPELLSPKKEPGDDADAKLLKGKEGLSEIFSRTKSLFEAINGEVEFSYKATYISLRTPKKQFAILQPSTKTRVDVGLNLKGVDPDGIVEPAGSWNAMVSHRVKLTDPGQVTKDLSGWFQRAYDANI